MFNHYLYTVLLYTYKMYILTDIVTQYYVQLKIIIIIKKEIQSRNKYFFYRLNNAN